MTSNNYEQLVAQYSERFSSLTAMLEQAAEQTDSFERLLETIDSLDSSERSNALRSALQKAERAATELRSAAGQLGTKLQDTASRVNRAKG